MSEHLPDIGRGGSPPRLFPDAAPRLAALPAADVAYTLPEVAGAVTRSLAPPGPGRIVWEPCAGGGDWLDAFEARGWNWRATEIDPGASSVQMGKAVCADALHPRAAPSPAAKVEVWTNPPFSLTDELLHLWTEMGIPRAVLLLRLCWIAAQSRREITGRIRAVHVLSPRISFTGPGRKKGSTDSEDYAVLDFRLQESRPPRAPAELHFLRWRER